MFQISCLICNFARVYVCFVYLTVCNGVKALDTWHISALSKIEKQDRDDPASHKTRLVFFLWQFIRPRYLHTRLTGLLPERSNVSELMKNLGKVRIFLQNFEIFCYGKLKIHFGMDLSVNFSTSQTNELPRGKPRGTNEG